MKFHILMFNQLQVQRLVCITVTPLWLHTCWKLPGTLSFSCCSEPQCTHVQLSPFCHLSTLDVTHVEKLPGLPCSSCNRKQRRLGNEASCPCGLSYPPTQAAQHSCCYKYTLSLTCLSVGPSYLKQHDQQWVFLLIGWAVPTGVLSHTGRLRLSTMLSSR